MPNQHINYPMSNLDDRKERLVVELFVETADEDYVSARWQHLNGFYRLFFWSASQVIEKYLKASLVLNGKSVVTKEHNIVSMFEELSIIAGTLVTGDLAPPIVVKRKLQKMPELWGSRNPRDFIEHISRNGNASNRYNTFGIKSEFSDLYKLDQVVFNLRRLSAKLDRVVPENETKTLMDLLISGDVNFDWSESLKKNLSSNKQAYHALKRENYAFFSKSTRSSKYNLISAHHVSELEIIFKLDTPENLALRKWIKTNIKINPNDLKKLSTKD